MDEEDDDLVPLHNCTNNHCGSSSSMEPKACLDMVINLYDNFHCIVSRICADDDSSTRSMLKWSNADYMRNNKTDVQPMQAITKGPNKGKLQVRPDKGKLPSHVPEPVFVADPNHRRKVLTGELLQLLSNKVADKFTLTKMDVTRIGKNFSYMIRQLPRMDEEQYVSAAKAVLDHHFDSHEFCGAWCRRKYHNNNNEEPDNNQRFYRSKTKDGTLYKKLEHVIERFVTFDRLREVAHGMDTNVNESFNNTFSWLAPKNKVYCGTQSLHNRLSIGIGIQSIGLLEYFKRLYSTLGISITPNVLNFLAVKEVKRSKRHQKGKQTETKKQRLQSKYAQLRLDEAIAKKERAKRDGTYKRGMNMDDIEEDEEQQKKPKARKNVVCTHCGKKGHTTTRSKKCLKHKDNLHKNLAGTTVTAETATSDPQVAIADSNDADDIDELDAMPLVDDPPSDASLAEFADCNTWSDNDAADDDSEDGQAFGII